jgi:hypothetical protein
VASWAIRWAVLFGLWVALTDTVKLQELIAGAIVSGLAATLAGAITIATATGVGAGAASLRAIGGPALRLVADTGVLALAVWRRLRFGRALAGSLRLERFAGDRLLTEWWGSLGPNRYVIGVDEEAGTMLVHELVSDDPGLDRANAEESE